MPKSWTTLLREAEAAQRRRERDARRRQRELEMRRKQLAKMQELERAAFEVQEHENRIDLLLTVHRECREPVDWEAIRSATPPDEPARSSENEEKARAALDGFKPGLLDKALKRVETKRLELEKAVESARAEDEANYQAARESHRREYEEWEIACNVANQVLSGAAEGYQRAITIFNPFSEIAALGSQVKFEFASSSMVEATLSVHGEDVIPKEVKTLLKSGKLSVKNMPKTKFYEVYQDHVCGCTPRVARELFALLPVKTVIVTAMGEILNTKTGHMEDQPILSVAMPRRTMEKINFEMIDPSDSMQNFVHNMKFSRTTGFAPVERVSPSDLAAEP